MESHYSDDLETRKTRIRKVLNKLPDDTLVYHCIRLGDYTIETVKELLTLDDDIPFLCFDECPKDGLWASWGARSIWDRFPHYHPHYSLFDALIAVL